MLLGMAYSGTRTAYAAFLGGVFFFILISWQNQSTRIFSIASLLFLLVFLYFPYYGNNTINRIRSTFIGKRDKSFEVRELNRKAIQPYIYAHPIGGGLGTTGDVGLANSPGHFLAGFPPDSGYLKKALETGWLGLILICILYYKILVGGVHIFLHSREEEFRTISGAIVCCIFGFYIAEIAQDAMGQISDMVIYYPFLAILIKLNQLRYNA
jgi:O-antigen ligase